MLRLEGIGVTLRQSLPHKALSSGCSHLLTTVDIRSGDTTCSDCHFATSERSTTKESSSRLATNAGRVSLMQAGLLSV